MSKTRELRGIYKRGNVYWFARSNGGKRHFVSLGTSSLPEAIQKAAAMRRAPAPDSSPLAGLLDRFLAQKSADNEFSPRTEEWTRTAFRRLLNETGAERASQIDSRALQHWFDGLRKEIRESSAQSYLRAVSSFFSWMVETHRIPENPAAGVHVGRVDRTARVRWVPADLRDRLIQNAPTDDLRRILVLGFFGGLRLGEILECRRDWIDAERRVLHVQHTETFRPKDRDARTVPLTETAVKHLMPLPRDPNAFVIAPDVGHGTWRYRWDPRRPWGEFMRRQKCQWITPHVMRHTFASLLVQRGISIYKVAQWLGDGVAVVERHYAHLAASDSDVEVLA